MKNNEKSTSNHYHYDFAVKYGLFGLYITANGNAFTATEYG